MTIRVYVFDPHTGKHRSGGTQMIDRALADERLHMWVDLHKISIKEEQLLLNRRLAVPMAAVRSFQCQEGPAFEERAGHVMLRMDELKSNRETLDVEYLPIGFFFTERFFVTRHAQPSAGIDSLWSELQSASAERICSDLIAVRLAGLLAGRYLTRLSTLELDLDAGEEATMLATDALATLNDQHDRLDGLCATIRKHFAIFDALKTLDRDISDSVRERLLDLEGLLRDGLEIADRYREKAD